MKLIMFIKLKDIHVANIEDSLLLTVCFFMLNVC